MSSLLSGRRDRARVFLRSFRFGDFLPFCVSIRCKPRGGALLLSFLVRKIAREVWCDGAEIGDNKARTQSSSVVAVGWTIMVVI